jgi:hypothetical protein
MRALVRGLPELTDSQQQRLGRQWLIVMNEMGITVDGVHIEFADEIDSQPLHDLLEDHWGTAWTEDDARLYDALIDWAGKLTSHHGQD